MNQDTTPLVVAGRTYQEYDLKDFTGVKKSRKLTMPDVFMVLLEERSTGLMTLLRTINLYETLSKLSVGTIGYSVSYSKKYTTRQERLANTRVWATQVTAREALKYTRTLVELTLGLDGRLFDAERQTHIQRFHRYRVEADPSSGIIRRSNA